MTPSMWRMSFWSSQSFACAWKIREPNFLMKTTGSIICQIRWLGSKLKPQSSRPSRLIASSAV